MKKIKGYKFITSEMKSKEGNHTWEMGKWYKLEGKIEPCAFGFHACLKPSQAFKFIYGDKLVVIEARGKIFHKKDDEPKFAASEMRVIKELPLKKISVEWACWCARQCLKNYEKSYPDDKRLANAIQAAEDYMDGKLKLTELEAAESAAESAWSAAQAAVESAEAAASAADAAAASAAVSAARSADAAVSAWSAAQAAAASAAESADAAASAAVSAARSADAAVSAWSAAQAAARSAASKKIDKIVKKYEENQK